MVEQGRTSSVVDMSEGCAMLGSIAWPAEAGRVSHVAPDPGYTKAPVPGAFCP